MDWYPGARHCPSTNCNERPNENDINMIIIHGISLPPGEFGGTYIDDLFCNQLNGEEHPYFQKIADLRVSSHLLIRRSGEIVQYVPFSKRAWHAGKSEFMGQEDCNDFSIGIELEGTDDLAYTDSQYHVLVEVCQNLMQSFPMTLDRIVGHCHVAPGRKTDPGEAFQWGFFKSRLKDALAEA